MDRKIALKFMFASDVWAKSTYTTTVKGKVANIILTDGRFWKFIQFSFKCVNPLVDFLGL